MILTDSCLKNWCFLPKIPNIKKFKNHRAPKKGIFPNFWIKNDYILWKWAGQATTSHEIGFWGFLTTLRFWLKGKDGRNFFFVFCYFSIDYVTVSQIKPCLNDSNLILCKKLMFSSKNSKYQKFIKLLSAKKRDISKFLNKKWLEIVEMR